MRLHKGFTVIELIVTITFIGVLSTIWFIQYVWYLEGVRDTTRISEITELYEKLIVYGIDNPLPIPDDYIEVKNQNNLIWYQWNLWKNTIKKLDYLGSWVDPKDQSYFTYVTTKNKKSFALMTFLEESLEENSLNPDKVVNKGNIQKVPYMIGKKVGILLNESNIPIHIEKNIIDEWNLDLNSSWIDNYSLYFSNEEIYTGTWSELLFIAQDYNCKRIKDLSPGVDSGIYFIDYDGDTVKQPIYCEMEVDGWGRNLLLKANGDNSTFEYDSAYWENSTSYNIGDYKYTKDEFKSDLFSTMDFTEVLLELNTYWIKKTIIIQQDWKSLEEIFSGSYLSSTNGRQEWKDLIADSSLQSNCNQEGFNVEVWWGYARIRLWIVGNQEDNCDSPDSRIWIWWNWSVCSQDDSNSVWNEAMCSPDNSEKHIKSFWYIYVR